MLTKIAALSLASLLTACASPFFDVRRTEAVLPLSRAWVDDKIVEYVTTDISDPNMARMLGINYVPRLAGAVRSQSNQSIVERVYKFPNEEQISIFQSAPNPVGAKNDDKNYSPLWQVIQVRWKKPSVIQELKSEEALLAAQEREEVELENTNIVVNCPVIRSATGHKLKGVR